MNTRSIHPVENGVLIRPYLRTEPHKEIFHSRNDVALGINAPPQK
ncbi:MULTISPECIES: hypothetical protein [Paenarthrobacter]|nr:hypothetical protein [Paenarthrobacter ureafaciens]